MIVDINKKSRGSNQFCVASCLSSSWAQVPDGGNNFDGGKQKHNGSYNYLNNLLSKTTKLRRLRNSPCLRNSSFLSAIHRPNISIIDCNHSQLSEYNISAGYSCIGIGKQVYKCVIIGIPINLDNRS